MAQPLSYSGDRTEINADYSVTPNDHLIAIVGLAASLTTSLPNPATFGPQTLIVKDETGLASLPLAITIAPPVGATIDGAANKQIVTASGALRLYSSRTNWFTA